MVYLAEKQFFLFSGSGFIKTTEGTAADLEDDVSQQPQVPVPHGPRPDQDLAVVAVMPLIVDGHDDPAETKSNHHVSQWDKLMTWWAGFTGGNTILWLRPPSMTAQTQIPGHISGPH